LTWVTLHSVSIKSLVFSYDTNELIRIIPRMKDINPVMQIGVQFVAIFLLNIYTKYLYQFFNQSI